MSIPDLDDVASFLYSVSQGARKVTPSFSNTYLDRPIKTFMQESYHPNLILDTKGAFYFPSYCNYYVMNRMNDEIGVLEEIFSEYRYLVGNLSKLLQQSLKQHKKVLNGKLPSHRMEREKGDTKIKMVEIDQDKYDSLTKVLKDEDSIIRFVEGIGDIGC